ncbi:hypothetical protein TNCV_2304901 [Trichonephila clavipes]|nr:hypothetical protein TNCV_2304901 [Trichonephila clavipes]
MARRKDLSPDESDSLLRGLLKNELDVGELTCSNFDSNEKRLSERDCEESEESADDNIPVYPDRYVTKHGTE